MKAIISNVSLSMLFVVVLALAVDADVSAHGGGNWDPFTIDRVNKDAEKRLIQLQQEISNLIRGRSDSTAWPPPEFQRMRDELASVKEEVDEVLEHYVSDGANLQLTANLHAEPRMGRTAAASRALGAAIGLIGHATTLDSREAFVKEFYGGGLSAYLYELLEAHKDRMDLYGQSMAGSQQVDNNEE